MTAVGQRALYQQWLDDASAQGACRKKSCAILGLSVRTTQRWQQQDDGVDQRTARSFTPVNKLSDDERAHVLSVIHSAEFAHLPPSQIVPRLADKGLYIASESTMYRLLHANGLAAHRNSERPSVVRTKPRALRATAPNQLYSWDITYLPSAIKGRYFYLYFFMDVFSKSIVGWACYEEENSVHASELMQDICWRENIKPQQVTLHSDNGGPMKGSTMLAMLQQLGVTPSFSRPAVSNDNPYSEALFKTLKYRPDNALKSFVDVASARAWVERFVSWYQHEHRHSAIRFVTPAQRHAGFDKSILARRESVYASARLRHPERWTNGTRNWKPVTVVHLNPEKTEEFIAVKTDHHFTVAKAA